MKNIIQLLLTLIFFSIVTACSSPEKLIEKGKYEKAITKSIKQNKKGKSTSSSLASLSKAYNLFQNDLLNKIDILHDSKDELRFERILNHYKSLHSMYMKMSFSSDILDYVNPIDYSYEINQYSGMATDIRFERGMDLLNGTTKKDFKNAYYEFEKALKISPGDKEIISKRDEALSLAITNVAIDFPRFNERLVVKDYTLEADMFYQQLTNFLMRNQNSTFLKFYPMVGLYKNNIRPDHFLFITFERLHIPKYRDDIQTRIVTKTIEKTEKKDAKDVTIKKTYKAEIITTTKRIKPQARIILSITDEENRTLWMDIIDEETLWENVTITYKGDKEALSDTDWNYINTSSNLLPPSDRILIDNLMKQVQTRVQNSISDIYKKWGL